MKPQPNLVTLRRLNELWIKADSAAEKAEYSKWNECLDRIYVNILYSIAKNPSELIKRLKKTKKTNCFIIDEASEHIHKHLAKKVFKAQLNLKKNNNNIAARSKLYHTLMQKDIWLRKYMIDSKLPLKRKNE